MSFCPNCGQQIANGVSFCPYCGSAVAAVTGGAVINNTVLGAGLNTAGTINVGNTTLPNRNDYLVVLQSRGTCTLAVAKDLLEDLLGYTTTQAATIMRSLPTQIATNMNAQQALTLSQAFAEYGMQVAIFTSDGYVDFSQYALSSVYDTNGSLLSNAINVLSTLSLANRLNNFNRWTYARPIPRYFTPTYYRAPLRSYTRYRTPARPRYAAPARGFRAPGMGSVLGGRAAIPPRAPVVRRGAFGGPTGVVGGGTIRPSGSPGARRAPGMGGRPMGPGGMGGRPMGGRPMGGPGMGPRR